MTEDSGVPAETNTTEDAPLSAAWDRDASRRSLDELFTFTRQYKSSKAYFDLLKFIAQFRFYAPFNAMLTHVQMPGAKYVAPPHRWSSEYGRRIKPGAHPIVILQPMGPVMFVFDVSDTVPDENAPSLPPMVEHPFKVHQGYVGNEFEQTVENAKRDGVSVSQFDSGSQRAGSIELAKSGQKLSVLVRERPRLEYVQVPLRYALLLNSKHSVETRYATLVHELAHLYCGHLGSPNDKWWPDRRDLEDAIQEFEAESICYLVCKRLGIDNPSAQYLAHYLSKNRKGDVPPISFERIMVSAGLIEQMGRARLKPRKDKE